MTTINHNPNFELPNDTSEEEQMRVANHHVKIIEDRSQQDIVRRNGEYIQKCEPAGRTQTASVTSLMAATEGRMPSLFRDALFGKGLTEWKYKPCYDNAVELLEKLEDRDGSW